ncbi:DDE-type integrase/transposase/recombinase [Nocardia tengchongensis]
MFVTIDGHGSHLWRAVDQNGVALDLPVQPQRNTKVAKRFFRKLPERQGRVPWVPVTERLGSPRVAALRADAVGGRIAAHGIRTIELRYRISQPGCGSRQCGGSSHPRTPSGSCSCSGSARTVGPRWHRLSTGDNRGVMADRLRCGTRPQGPLSPPVSATTTTSLRQSTPECAVPV